MSRPGRVFRIFLAVLLAGIFIELLSIISILTGGPSERGDVAVVELSGPIDESRPTVEALKKYVDQDDVKAIVLRVDSPGGAIGSSQEIHDAVEQANRKKSVVVSMGNVAASGGYYVSAPAAKILADPGTITGSIGVISQFFVVEDLLKKAHLRWEVIKAGDVKDIGSPLKMMTEKERKLLQGLTDDMHEQFIEAVAKGRRLSIEKVRKLADGSIYSGRKAKELGLVDALGGLEAAVKLAGELGKVKGEPKVILPERERFRWFKRLADGKFEAPSLRIEYRFLP
ncbi:MAG: signal peptide peptidase SppA [Pseudomonadota bacterium]